MAPAASVVVTTTVPSDHLAVSTFSPAAFVVVFVETVLSKAVFGHFPELLL